ncbi:MAG: YicC family protein [Desulfovibrionaceae bacterium]|nr:YicC family protein [Desulfovibrionaceae bacterium]
MLRSMTGFGRCLIETHGISQQWEIRSVNGRHLDLKWRLPSSVHGIETRLEKLVKRKASRGRVEISLYLQFSEDSSLAVNFNQAQAQAMLDKLQEFAALRGDTFTPDYNKLLSLNQLWQDNSEEQALEVMADLQEGLELALDDWNEGRTSEGKALGLDLHNRILAMEEWTHMILERAPQIKEERLQNLRERVTEALEKVGCELEENRFLQEIVLLSDHLDVTEELTRLVTHLARLHELLSLGEDAGRKLDFTLQECFREINTCGNKVSDAEISHIVVDFKNELEKCREQVQNLE